MKQLRVALVHDYLKEYGGAERVLEALHEIFPDAPVFTSVYMPEYLGPHKARFKNWDIRTSFLQHIPFKAKLISPFRLIAPYAFRTFDFSQFDVIIVSSTGAYFPTMLRKKEALLISYCHTPPRYLYGYATAREWKKYPLINLLGMVANHVLRLRDYNASQNVDYFIANSKEVAGRIKKFYRKEAVVIYPPVDIHPKFETRNSKLNNDQRYFVTGGRLARAKHPGLVIRACTELGIPLKVFGRSFAGYGEELRALAGETVEFLGEVTEEKKKELIREARAAIFAFEDEDFGILPVEVMGEGTPVIAYKSGGLKETVIEGKTGLFFNQLTTESIKESIGRFEKLHFSPKDCYEQAKAFNPQRFTKEIRAFVNSVTKTNEER